MKKLISILLTMVFALLLVSCQTSGGNSTSDGGSTGTSTGSTDTGSTDTGSSGGGSGADDYEDIIVDPMFEKGFTVMSQDNGHPSVVGTIGFGDTAPARGTPVWSICQWNSGHYHREGGVYPDAFNIALAERTISRSGFYVWQDQSKTFRVNPETGEITMGIKGSEEYPTPRKDGQPWPHILLQYAFSKNPMLSDIEHCYLQMDYTLTKSEAKDPNPNPNLHAAEFLFYCVLTNVNPQSPDKGQFIWFGAQLYDNRQHDHNVHVATYAFIDTNTTSGFIYKPDSSKYCNRIPKVGVEVNVLWDMLPEMRNALLAAQGKGYLTHTEFSDLRLGSGNFGWELPGTYDVSVDIADLHVFVG